MSRSFGDEIGHSCGIICTPGSFFSQVVKQLANDEAAVCLVVGSDGVFEMLAEGTIAAVCHHHLAKRDAESAARDLAQKAFQSWSQNMVGYVDDITCVVAYLNKSSQLSMNS